jgi:deoxyadenosine/deoxycytidine kinase
MRIVIVGPCASGTTTLADNLRAAGYDAHACAQEHSYVPDMWRMSQPDVLIYLDANMETIKRRREVRWSEERLAAEKRRLAHARQNCHLYLATDELTREEVLEKVELFLELRAPRCTTLPFG